MILFTLGAMAHIRYYIISEHAYVLTTNRMSQPVKEIVSKLFHLTAITWILKANSLFLFYQRIKPRNDSFEYHSTFHYFIGLRNYFDFILRNLLLKLTVICKMLQKKFNILKILCERIIITSLWDSLQLQASLKSNIKCQIDFLWWRFVDFRWYFSTYL